MIRGIGWPFLRNTAWGMLAEAVGMVASLGTAVLLARWLAPAVHGQVQAALALLAVLGFAAQPGAVAATIHRIASEARPVRPVLGAALALVTVSGGAAVGVLALAGPRITEGLLLGLPLVAYAAVLAAVPLQLWGLVFGGVARATDRFDEAAVAGAAPAVARLASVGALAAVAPATAAAAAGGLLVAQALATAVAAGWIGRRTGVPSPPEVAEMRALTRFGSRTWLHTLAGQLHERVDVFLLAALAQDPAAVAAYAVAVGVVTRLRALPLAMSSALFPQVAALGPEAGWSFTVAVARRGTAATVLGAGALGLVAPVAIPWLFGAAYSASVGPAVVLLPAMVAQSAYLLVGRYFQAIDHQSVNVAAQGVGVALNVVLNLWWIPAHGVWGAAAATAASYTVQAAWVSLAFLRARPRG